MKKKKLITLDDYYHHNYRHNKRCSLCGQFISINKGYACAKCCEENTEKHLKNLKIWLNYEKMNPQNFWKEKWIKVKEFFRKLWNAELLKGDDKEFY